jgi:hypothetical protein
MNFELTISGLNIVVVKSQEEYPEHPDSVEIICPKAMMHRPMLSYLPGQFQSAITPALVVDPGGNRIASEDARKNYYELSFATNPPKEFALKWGPSPDYNEPWEEDCMNWLPSLDDLGFKPFAPGPAGTLPHGATSRFSLPPGELICREMTRDRGTNEVLLWHFPSASNGDGLIRALANLVVYRVMNVDNLNIKRNGKTVLTSNQATLKQGETLRMCLSNDMKDVPLDYNSPQQALDHLQHLDAIAKLKGKFKPPTVVPRDGKPKHTGHPICNQVIFIDNGQAGG